MGGNVCEVGAVGGERGEKMGKMKGNVQMVKYISLSSLSTGQSALMVWALGLSAKWSLARS